MTREPFSCPGCGEPFPLDLVCIEMQPRGFKALVITVSSGDLKVACPSCGRLVAWSLETVPTA